MSSPFNSGLLNLQLFDLRRESVLREARAWFLRDFNPTAFVEVVTALRGERNASFRMVLGYWDMPTVRRIVREAAKDDYRFKSIVLGVVSSDAFRKREAEDQAPAPAKPTSTSTSTGGLQ